MPKRIEPRIAEQCACSQRLTRFASPHLGTLVCSLNRCAHVDLKNSLAKTPGREEVGYSRSSGRAAASRLGGIVSPTLQGEVA
jgi:hypothetical protein